MSPDFGWDAGAYVDAATVQQAWGVALMELRRWRGDERVLDAGCGAGNVTEILLKHIPRGRLVAVDVDPDMVEKARARLAPLRDRANVLQGDLLHLGAMDPVDVVYSNAVFHWILDHDRLFAELFRHLRPGGELLAQCGGEGNLENVRKISEALRSEEPFAPYFRGWKPPWNYQDDASTQERLLIVGFVEPDVRLTQAPTKFPDDGSLAKFVKAVILRAYFARLPDEKMRQLLLERFLGRMDDAGMARTLDYVRLTIRASRSPHG